MKEAIIECIEWLPLIFATLLAVGFVVFSFKVFFGSKASSTPIEIKVALIGAVTVILTVLGSVITTQRTNASNAALQRAAEVRRIKQQYYNGYWEAFWKKQACQRTTPNDRQAQLKADLTLCMESGRLPLYASQAFTELIGRTMQSEAEAAKVTIAQMYECMRDDLVSDNYAPFTRLKFDSIMFPLPLDSRNADRTTEKGKHNESQQSAPPLPRDPQPGHSEGER